MAEKKNTNICWENEKDNLDRMINQEHKSGLEIGKLYGVSSSTIYKKLKQFSINISNPTPKKILNSIDEIKIKEAVKNNLSWAGVLRSLGLKPTSGNYTQIKGKVKNLNLNTSHFTGKLWNKGKKVGSSHQKYQLKDILVKDSTYPSSKLNKRLQDEGLKEHKCEICGKTEWNGFPIPLELHHKNGDHFDNRLENLQLVCPNCHSLTDTYCKRKDSQKKKGR